MTDGFKSTEFWLTLAAMIASTWLLMDNKIDPELWAAVMAIAPSGYSVSRGIAKVGSKAPVKGK